MLTADQIAILDQFIREQLDNPIYAGKGDVLRRKVIKKAQEMSNPHYDPGPVEDLLESHGL